MKRIITQLLLCACLVAGLTAAGWSLPTIGDLIGKVDEVEDLSHTDLTAKVSLVQQKVSQGTKSFEALYYRRDRKDLFMIVMIAPDSDKGNGYLKVGDNMWMYRVNTRTFQHINRDESISGTDSKSGDFEKRKLTELYVGTKDKDGNELVAEEVLGKIPVYRFELKAKVNDVTYPKKIYWIRTDNFLPLKIQDFSLSGTLMQTEYYPQYTTVESRFIPIKMLFIDEFEKGNKTLVELSGISLKELEDSIFTKGYLENISK